MKKYDPNQPIIFVHIPKCAGTSFIRLLRAWFRRKYHHPHVDETTDELPPRVEVKNADGTWNPDVKCIHAHFDHGRGYGLPDYYPEINQYFTVLRDPFDIVVSMYFFAKGKSEKGAFLYRGQVVDIRDQYPTVEHYVREHPYWLYNHLPQNITLENYRETISEKFVYLGIFEELESSIRQLGLVLGKPPVTLPHHNESRKDETVPEKLRERFYEEHPLLKAVYEFARLTYSKTPAQLVRLKPSQVGKTGVRNMLASVFGRKNDEQGRWES